MSVVRPSRLLHKFMWLDAKAHKQRTALCVLFQVHVLKGEEHEFEAN